MRQCLFAMERWRWIDSGRENMQRGGGRVSFCLLVCVHARVFLTVHVNVYFTEYI